MDPSDTLSMRDKEYEVTSVSNNLQCSMPFDSPPLPCTDVLGDEIIDIDLPSKDQVDTLSMGDRIFENIDFLLEELAVEISQDDSISTRIDDGYNDSEDDILYLEQFLNEDTSSDLSPALLPKEPSLLVPSFSDFKQICLREVEKFDLFFFMTQSGEMTRVMERPFDRFFHMSLPR
ncbi:hypothetical protein Tco_0478660 [Tanacetum coccineum]